MIKISWSLGLSVLYVILLINTHVNAAVFSWQEPLGGSWTDDSWSTTCCPTSQDEVQITIQDQFEIEIVSEVAQVTKFTIGNVDGSCQATLKLNPGEIITSENSVVYDGSSIVIADASTVKGIGGWDIKGTLDITDSFTLSKETSGVAGEMKVDNFVVNTGTHLNINSRKLVLNQVDNLELFPLGLLNILNNGELVISNSAVTLDSIEVNVDQNSKFTTSNLSLQKTSVTITSGSQLNVIGNIEIDSGYIELNTNGGKAFIDGNILFNNSGVWIDDGSEFVCTGDIEFDGSTDALFDSRYSTVNIANGHTNSNVTFNLVASTVTLGNFTINGLMYIDTGSEVHVTGDFQIMNNETSVKLDEATLFVEGTFVNYGELELASNSKLIVQGVFTGKEAFVITLETGSSCIIDGGSLEVESSDPLSSITLYDSELLIKSGSMNFNPTQGGDIYTQSAKITIEDGSFDFKTDDTEIFSTWWCTYTTVNVTGGRFTLGNYNFVSIDLSEFHISGGKVDAGILTDFLLYQTTMELSGGEFFFPTGNSNNYILPDVTQSTINLKNGNAYVGQYSELEINRSDLNIIGGSIILDVYANMSFSNSSKLWISSGGFWTSPSYISYIFLTENSTIEIDGGDFVINGTSLNIESGCSITIKNGNMIVENGFIQNKGLIKILNGDFKLDKNTDATFEKANMIVEGGSVYVTNHAGFTLVQNSSIQITGGSVDKDSTSVINLEDVSWIRNDGNIVGGGTINVPSMGSFDISPSGLLLVSKSSTFAGEGMISNAGDITITDPDGSNFEVGIVNMGKLKFKDGNTILYSITQNQGSTQLDGGNVTIMGSEMQINGGTLTGSGTISGTVNNSGIIQAPSNSSTTLTISNFKQGPSGKMIVNMLADGPDTQVTTPSLSLDGTIQIKITNEFYNSNQGRTDVTPILTFNEREGNFQDVVVDTSELTVEQPGCQIQTEWTSTTYVLLIAGSGCTPPAAPMSNIVNGGLRPGEQAAIALVILAVIIVGVIGTVYYIRRNKMLDEATSKTESQIKANQKLEEEYKMKELKKQQEEESRSKATNKEPGAPKGRWHRSSKDNLSLSNL